MQWRDLETFSFGDGPALADELAAVVLDGRKTATCWAAIEGLKVGTENGWFAARPSGTEDIYKIYGESFRGEDHLKRILEEAQGIVDAALKK